MVLWLKNLPGRIYRKIKSLFNREKTWQDIEYFHENWKGRISTMAGFIDRNTSVMDLGCGKMWLKKYLPQNCEYIPVDYIKRSPECIVADFNKKQFPTIKADVLFISGCLEYVNDYSWFISELCTHGNRIIISYCTTEKFPDRATRKDYAWVNHLSSTEIINLFEYHSFQLKQIAYTQKGEEIFIFNKP